MVLSIFQPLPMLVMSLMAITFGLLLFTTRPLLMLSASTSNYGNQQQRQ